MPDNNKTICTQYNNNEKLSENRIVMMNLQRIAEVLSIFELWQIKKCLTQGQKRRATLRHTDGLQYIAKSMEKTFNYAGASLIVT